MKKFNRNLSQIFSTAWVFIGFCSFVVIAMCEGPYDNVPLGEQSTWNYNAYKFLEECGQGACQAFEPDISGMRISNQTPLYGQTAGGDSANFWLRQGNRLYLDGSYSQAEASYANAVKLDPSLLEGWLNMGNARYLLGRYEDSLDAYDAVLKQDPQNASALRGESMALLALNRTDEADTVRGSLRATKRQNSTEL